MSLHRFGLYYPDMRPDSEWLGMAALYWPKLARIVPAGVDPDHAPDVRLLRDELDFLVDVTPERASAAISGRMLDFLDRHGQDLMPWYRVDLSEVRDIELVPDQGLGRIRTTRGVHEAKIGGEVLQVLATQGLAVRDNELLPWLMMENRLAEVYLCALAEQVAADNALTPVTDTSHYYVGASGWTVDRLTHALLAPGVGYSPTPFDPAEIPGALGMLALQLVIPAGPGGARDRVPVGKVVELRRRHGAQFIAFREQVESLADEVATELAGVADPSVFDAYLDDLARTRLVEPMRELQRAVEGMRLTAGSHALTMKFEVVEPVASVS